MSASSDAGPLIWLGRCSLLRLLKKTYSEIDIPEAVYREAVTSGLVRGYHDAITIKNAIEQGWIRVTKTSKQFTHKVERAESSLGIELGEGEREAIALTFEKGVLIFLTNDEDAHRIGRTLGLDPKGILYILLRGVREGHLNQEQVKKSLKQMLEEGFWPSPTIIHNFHEVLYKIT